MEFLSWLQSIHNPICDAFFEFITMFGDETVIILIGMLFYWCISKKQGYYVLSVGLIGTIINQFLKLVFRVPRPWIIDKSFVISESVLETAPGFSFPSGHTQNSVGIYSSVALWSKGKTLKIISIALCVLVPFSRLYLGVHTPTDVLVSVVLALALSFALYPFFKKEELQSKVIRSIFAIMALMSVLFLVFAYSYNFPADVDAANVEHGIEIAFKMLAVIVGLWLTFEIDTRYIKFTVKSVWWVQILKIVVGLIPVFAIKSLLKEPLQIIIGNEYVADCARYFILTVFIGIVWPLTFKFWNKLGERAKKVRTDA